jgi:lysophospholipase L1-like esterase
MSRLAAAVLVLMLVLVAGCSSDDSPVASPARTTGAPSDAPTAYDQYVALGDSYTAAPLVPPTDTSSICLRSGANYPALIAAAMPGTALTDVSCSGASTRNTTAPQTGHGGEVPPQLDALRAGTDLVTIGLGGNDAGLFGTMIGRCTQLAASDPTGSPCRTALSEGRSDQLTDVLGQIRDGVAGVVAGVHRRSPNARIVVVGYPQIVPPSGTCDLLPLAAGDYSYAREINEGLAQAVRLGATDAEYVDLWAPSAGHDICSTDPWINGRVTSADRAFAYHPLAVEQRAVADLVLARIADPAQTAR